MTPSQHPSVDETLELLERLKETVRDFSAREEKLNRESSAETARLNQYFEQTLEENFAKAASDADDAEAAFEIEKQRAQAFFARRKERITQIHRAAKQRRIGEVEGQEGHRKFEIQRGLLQAEHDRDAALKETEASYENFVNELAAERAELENVERKARAALGDYRKFLQRLASAPMPAMHDSLSHTQMLENLRTHLNETKLKIRRFQWQPFPLLFRFLPWWWFLILVVLVSSPLMPLPRPVVVMMPDWFRNAGTFSVVILAVISVLYALARYFSAPLAKEISVALAEASALHDACEEKSFAWRESEIARIETESGNRAQSLQGNWKLNIRKAAESRADVTVTLEQRAMRALQHNDKLAQQKIARLEHGHADGRKVFQHAADVRKRELEKSRAEKEKQLAAKYSAQWQALEAEWKTKMQGIYAGISAAQAAAEKLFPDWQSLKHWTPPQHFARAVKFGALDVDLKKLSGVLPRSERLALPGPAQFHFPLTLTFPQQGCVLFETKNSGHDEIIGTLNNIILRLLSAAPPGRVNFTIIDPVELGQNFAGVMHLADFEPRLINSRIWTQGTQIEEQLANLSEHIEKVTQMYLRNEFADIAEYNEQAGRIAEKYHFLVVADFPTNFSDVASKRLLSIAASGPRCGVYTLIHWDQRKQSPVEFVPDELRKNSVVVQPTANSFALMKKIFDGVTLRLDSPPDADTATEFLKQVGQHSIDSNRVEVPFADVAPPEAEVWRQDTTTEVRVPIGRTGATKLQMLALGKGTRQHALVAGKTGSGKSTLFHVIITNLSMWCSPEQVEFYLVDFKKGVEFKCYGTHRLPHARVVAIESDREFGLSVLQRVDEELKRRGEMFRKLGVQDIPGYKKAGGTEAIPRTLLLIDEFQEFFVEDDKVSQSAAMLLDRIVRQGRAFGIHVILGSQTLGGAYTLARATLGQMVVRVALQCNEADAYLIMDESNPAPRLLSRPGEAIYNDTAGMIAGNSPFQIVWLNDDERDTYLMKVRSLAEKNPKMDFTPIVFEGNAPAHIEENEPLRKLLEAESIKPTTTPRAWLGAPNSIKGPTEAVFKRQSGNHLLIVGQREEAALSLLGVSMISLAAQHPRGSARFVFLDAEPLESPQRRFVEKVLAAVESSTGFQPVGAEKDLDRTPKEPHRQDACATTLLAGNAELDDIMSKLAEEIEKRNDPKFAATAPAIYVLVHGLQRFKKLRAEEDFGFSTEENKAANPGTVFNKLISEGASLGIHVICSCDTLNNVNRFLSRKALSEIELRVLFQMSANDSATLIDSPKANDLGLHRAIFSNEQEGHLETFRPYALPDEGWIEIAAKSLKRLLG